VSDEKKPNALVQLSVLTVSRLFVNTGLRMVYPFLPAFARGLGVSLPVLASFVSVRGFASLVSPLFGPLSERFGRRKILALAMVLFSGGCLIVFIWPELWAFVLTLAAVSVAKVIYDPAMQAYIGDTVPYEKRGRSLAITELSWAGAFFLGVPLVSFAIQEQSWQAPFIWLAILGIFAGVALFRLLPKVDGRIGTVTNLRESWHVIRQKPVIWAAAIYILLVMAANELILIVYGDWMETSFGLSITSLGLATAVIGGAEVTGEVMTAIAVDRIGKRPFVITTGIVTAVMYFLLPNVSVVLVAALISLFVLFFFFEMTVVGGIPIMTELVPWARGIVLSVILAAGGLGRAIGALVGPILWTQGDLQLLGLVSAITMGVATAILAIWIHEGREKA
jgi:predicted MFS family arabinose efflux permease